ncbi:class V lanthionine synthetase subunit LxmK [Streptomyces sp. NPDC048241]|uniref:class V lanthionine synthetase subunit LxmK n=1 Tax=Streptomyces sp. NPDC048241 TaxID=3365521 RepID=UPI00372004AD
MVSHHMDTRLSGHATPPVRRGTAPPHGRCGDVTPTCIILPATTTRRSSTGGQVQRTRATFTPSDLEVVPAVNALLGELGVGRLRTEDVESLFGRNENWAGTTDAGVGVFVKRVSTDGGPQDADRRVARTRSFAALVAGHASPDLATPELIGHDRDSRVLVFRLLADARTFAELAADDGLDEDLARRAGRATGLLHGLDTTQARPPLEGSPFPFPDLGLLRSLPLGGFMGLTFAEVTLWRILHGDAQLIEALAALRAAEEKAPRVPTHCDLRFDQFLLADGVLHLTDGEEFRRSDAARDIGSMAGEWLYRAVTGLTGRDTRDDADTLTVREPTHAEIIARGVAEMDRARPLISAFWSGYRSARPDGDPELAARATAFAGWHMIDRAMATAARGSRLPAVTRAAMGIGRTALLAPREFVGALGLEERR